ncbi:unnamed protein product [Gadus morhua 'NCC']
MEPYLDLEAHINVLNPGLYEPEGGPKLDTLDMIKIRIAQLKFRRKVLLKGVQFRMRVSESQEEEVQSPELAAISAELRHLTCKARELGFFEDDDEDLTSPTAEECLHWPAPPPCERVPNANEEVPIAELGREPGVTGCPNCGEVVTTKIVKKRGDANWMLCCLLAMFGCIGGCCLIPFCVGNLMDVQHSCPSCQTTIHKREKI